MSLLQPSPLHSLKDSPSLYPSSLRSRSKDLIFSKSSLKLKRTTVGRGQNGKRRLSRVFAAADQAAFRKMNLNEYMVTLERPLGIRFALSVDGRIFVHSMKKGGNAEKSRIIMVGDTVKKASSTSDGGGGFSEIKDLNDARKILKEISETEDVEWAFGSFPLEEYIKALDRAKGELYYNHSLGMQYSKITEQIYVGSCIQTESDVQTLSNMGITAVLNFQSESEHANWGINSESINDSCHHHNILMVNYPIREVDSVDLRKKLPFCVGLLLRLLRKNFRIFVTCTTGLDRSPACVIAYLHWIQDTALHAAHGFVTGLHSCRSDRPAIVWATWDLIAMVENGKYDGPPTHAVNFVWNNGSREGEEVYLVGDFTGNWKDSVKAEHKGGSKYEVELRLRHGKYNYKFIVGGQWRHSSGLPTETDEHGNVNNVIRVGDVARIKPAPTQLQVKDPTVVKVIERQLTEDERFLLAFAARRIAFSICPVKLTPK
ncbi:phosphoglucan phosphatase LSF1, chloroplastic isoform X4 [Asparagus officinalis]|uniref:phosphoglucan phosphatase LSF1, chloroplastic isoform X4 n=1 Tax=Asparagus officinalis TaxID=4686 RepID=UPI00098E6EDC|nr:phosphoglucan phosphatase LSF1, chloroplastic isoform X4 [Asparagus officinalis]